MTRLLLVCIVTGIYHSIDSLYYAARISAVRVGKLAIALSLFNVIVLGTRFANMIQAPLTGSFVDTALAKHPNGISAQALTTLAGDFRWIILAATIGSIIGAFMIPTFVEVFTKVLHIFEREGSMFRLFARLGSARTYSIVAKSIKMPALSKPPKLTKTSLPRFFIIANVVLVAFYTVGVLATIFSGALIPAYRLTADNLSGLVNGVASMLLVLMVDPAIALITDQAVAKERPEYDVKVMVWYLVAGKIVGTLLAQLLFWPGAQFIAASAQLIAKPLQAFHDPSILLQYFTRLI